MTDPSNGPTTPAEELNLVLDRAEDELRDGNYASAARLVGKAQEYPDSADKAQSIRRSLIAYEVKTAEGSTVIDIERAFADLWSRAADSDLHFLAGRAALNVSRAMVARGARMNEERVRDRERWLTRAREHMQREYNPSWLVRVLADLVDAALERDDLKTAHERLAQVEKLHNELDLDGLMHLELQRGELSRRRDRPAEAVAYCQRAVELSDAVGLPLSQCAARANLALSLLMLQRVDSGANGTSDANRYAREALWIRERLRSGWRRGQARASFLQAYGWIDHLAWAAAVQANDGWGALEVAELGRGGRLRAMMQPSDESVDEETFRRIRRLDLRLEADLAVGAHSARSAPAAHLHVAAERASELEKALERDARAFSNTETLQLDLRRLRASLPPEAHVLVLDLWQPQVEWSSHDDEVIPLGRIWSPPSADPLLSQHVIPKELLELLRSLSLGGPAAKRAARIIDSPMCRELLTRVLLPEELVQEARERRGQSDPLRLLIVPSGPLWFVPFAAIDPFGDGGHMIESAELGFLPGLALLDAGSDVGAESPTGVFVHADVVAGARQEVETLQRVFTGDRTPEEAPGKREILALMDRRHFLGVISGHGTEAAGLEQGVFLADGNVLTAGDLLDRTCPETFVFGSCFSSRVALERGTEAVGLPTVALLGGAQSVIAGRWQLPSEATADVLCNVYEALARGASPTEALRSAQLVEAELLIPFYDWAGLIAVGGFSGKSHYEADPGASSSP